MVSAEIPDKDENPALFQAVTKWMLHKKCCDHDEYGWEAPCLGPKDTECPKHFPKEFLNETCGNFFISRKIFYGQRPLNKLTYNTNGDPQKTVVTPVKFGISNIKETSTMTTLG